MQDQKQQESEFQAGIPPRLIAIFYAIFDDDRGPTVSLEVPEGSILPIKSSNPIIDFESISEYIIPKKELCGHLVTICTDSYKVMGFPTIIRDNKYPRYNFEFNICFVFERSADTSSYEPVVRKVATIFHSLEVEIEFLYNNKNYDFMYNIIEQLLEDLNNYCESQIYINELNTINLKLYPTYRHPPPVYDYQVPISTVNLQGLMDENWDITMKKVAKRINGIDHVKKIADLAEVDCSLARKCMQHLLYYGCIIMIDIFQFSNVYTPKPEITKIIDDKKIQHECLSYVRKEGAKSPSFTKLFSFYCDLKYGMTVKEWLMENKEIAASNIDIRRFISFGIIRSFIYRVHKYPILPEPHQSNKLPENLCRLLDGKHHYDEICTMENISAKGLDEILSQEPE
ncbi:10874_t:CDS:2, partial [Acaulospora morrowiae]